MPKSLTLALRDEYTTLFARMEPDAHRRDEINRIYRRITLPANKARYEAVERDLGVPWFVVALIHNLESGCNFERHLHNGDSLAARTIRVPPGRPAAPPADGTRYAWAESAADALGMKRLEAWTDWSVPGIAYVLERYNGFGYRNKYPFVKSPYLWGFSNVYVRGKFVADGVFSSEAVSQQCGGMTLLRHIMEQDATVAQRLGFAAPAPDDEEEDARPTPHPAPADDDSERDYPANPPKFPGRYLLKGIPTGRFVREVKAVQARLAALGAAPKLIDGVFDTTTEFAVKLFQARSVDTAGRPLEIDGIVGPNTWSALFGPAVAPDPLVKPTPGGAPINRRFAEAVLDVANSQLEILERPPGSNSGPEVEDYLRSVKLGRGNPWCMAFVYWCFVQAAGPNGVNRVPQTGHVKTAWARTLKLTDGVTVVPAKEARVDPSLVQPGMAFFMDMGGALGHCGIVADNINGDLVTIEGNTNGGGSREGVGVFRRVGRKVGTPNMLGFAAYG